VLLRLRLKQRKIPIVLPVTGNQALSDSDTGTGIKKEESKKDKAEMLKMLVLIACFAWIRPSSGFIRVPPRSARSSSQITYAMSETSSKPRWAGNDDVLSLFVNMLINFKPLFSLMKPLARSTLIKTAESNGIPWINSVKIAEKYENLFQNNLDDIVKENPLPYPGYY